MRNKNFLHFPQGGLERIIVLGAGYQLLVVSDFCIRHNVKLEIYTGQRHLDIVLSDGNKLFDRLKAIGCSICICDSLELIENGPFQNPDSKTLIISFGSPFIIKQGLIDLYQGRIINSHGAPLPEFRGGGGLTWRFLAGDTRGVILFHRITTEIDDGAILYKKDFEFPWPAKTVKEWLVVDEIQQALGLKDFLDRLMAGEKFVEVEQNRSNLTYFPRLNTDLHGFIDLSWHGEMIARFIGAFSPPYSGASSFIGGQKIRILSAEFVPDNRLQHPFLWGLVVRICADYYWMACQGGILKVPSNAVSPLNFVKVGDRIYTPSSYIDSAFSERVVYTPKGIK